MAPGAPGFSRRDWTQPRQGCQPARVRLDVRAELASSSAPPNARRDPSLFLHDVALGTELLVRASGDY